MSKDLRNLTSPYVHAPIYKVGTKLGIGACLVTGEYFEGELVIVPKCDLQREPQCLYPIDPYERREFLNVRHLQ